MKVKLPKPVADIYRAVKELEAEFPGRKFTPDGHLVGSIGEAIAAKALNLTLYPASRPGHDARDENGRDVQIKMTAGNSVSLYATCDRLVVLKVNPEQLEAEIVYDGPGEPAWAAAGKMQKNGQRVIGLKKLLSLRSLTASRTPRPPTPEIASRFAVTLPPVTTKLPAMGKPWSVHERGTGAALVASPVPDAQEREGQCQSTTKTELRAWNVRRDLK